MKMHAREYIFEVHACGRKVGEHRAEIVNADHRVPRIVEMLRREYACFGEVEIKIFAEVIG